MIRREIDKEGNKASDHVERSAFFCTGTYYGSMRDIGAYALIIQANELASWGIYAASAEAQITIPADMDKSRINSIRNHLKRAVKRLSEEGFLIEELKIQGGIQTAVKVPAVRVTAAGSERTKRLQNACLTARAGQDILLAGWIGIEGTLRIVGERERELRERFTPSFIRQIKAYDDEIAGFRKIAAAEEAGISFIRQITEGGILAALWRLSQETGLGMELDMKKFAVRQETIEVCEYFRLNPYQLTSGGSFLMLAEHGGAAAEALWRKGIAAAVIGRLDGGNDKVIRNGEDMRYIDRPAPDELMKVFDRPADVI